MRRILLQSYPNREVRMTLVREQVSRRKSKESHDEMEKCDRISPSPYLSLAQNSKLSTKPQPKGSLDIDGKPGYGGLPRHQKFSTYARRQILRAGGALEKAYPHNECLFLTLTLPGSTKVSKEALARYSGFAVQRLKAWLGKWVKNNLSIYTWEWQKRGALHLHYVLHVASRERGEYIRTHLKKEWIRILDSIGEASKVDMYAKQLGFSWATNKEVTRVDAQWCEKSVAAYLSKYVSKAQGSTFSIPKGAFCPSRWYGVSRPLLQMLREMTFAVSIDSLKDSRGWETYYDCLSVLQSWSLKCYEYKHKVGDGRTTVTYCNSDEQDSIWNLIMTQFSINPDSCANTEQTLKRLARNGVAIMRRYKTWHDSFTQFCANTRVYKIMQLPSYRDISRADLVFLLDMLAYSYRYTQRTRYDLPGECKLWYSQTARVVNDPPESDREWIGALKL